MITFLFKIVVYEVDFLALGDMGVVSQAPYGRIIAGKLILLGISIIGVLTHVIISLFISNEKDISKIIADVENSREIRGRVRDNSIFAQKNTPSGC